MKGSKIPHEVCGGSEVPFTNYGIAIAQMKGILKRSIELFPNLNVE